VDIIDTGASFSESHSARTLSPISGLGENNRGSSALANNIDEQTRISQSSPQTSTGDAPGRRAIPLLCDINASQLEHPMDRELIKGAADKVKGRD
jgi:hypothetical protein